jgi:hypothetical protein
VVCLINSKQSDGFHEVWQKFTDAAEGHVAFHCNAEDAAHTTVNVANF